MFGGGLPVIASNRKSDKQKVWATLLTNLPTDATNIRDGSKDRMIRTHRFSSHRVRYNSMNVRKRLRLIRGSGEECTFMKIFGLIRKFSL
ncbi:hypothetical protein D3C87_702900 [compost metagenome]